MKIPAINTTSSSYENSNINRNLALQTQDIIYAVENIYRDPNLHTDSLAPIKDRLGIIEIGKTPKDGIVFDFGDKTLRVAVKGKESIIYSETDKKTGKPLKNIYVIDRRVEKSLENGSSKRVVNAELKEVESYLSELQDDVDFRLLKIKQELAKHSVKIPYYPPVVNITKVKPLPSKPAKIKKAAPPQKEKPGILSDSNMQLTADITALYNEIYDKLDNIKNPATRSRIRNEYSAIKSSGKNSRDFDFAEIGPMCEDISVKLKKDHNRDFLIIKVKKINDDTDFIGIGPDGRVHKSPTKELDYLKSNSNPKYYTQKELDGISVYMVILRKELKKYLDFLTDRIQKKDDFFQKHLTNEVGELKDCEDLILNLSDQYAKYQQNIRLIKDTNLKNQFKKEMGIHGGKGHPFIIMERVTPFNEHMHLSFRTSNDKQYTQLIIFDSDKQVKRTFLLEGNRLVKFDAKNIFAGKRSDRKTHYYSQEEIDKMNVAEYLQMANDRLHLINTNLVQRLEKSPKKVLES